MNGRHFVDAAGTVVQLRGVNNSGLESVAMQGWDPGDPWGGMGPPSWSALSAWKVNAVRLPLNEASWLGYSCVDADGATHDPDPGKNYQDTVKKTVAQATANGFYVLLDLHWSAPGSYCAEDQNPMADADHSVTFWQQIADTFKGNPAVVFEMYNEPMLYDDDSNKVGDTSWNMWLNGGTYYKLRYPNIRYNWKVAGMQQLIDTVRATGATNVILVAGLDYANNLTGWSRYKPKDSAGQLGAAWHTYPPNPYVNVSDGSSTVQMIQTVAADVPVAVTEIGDVDGPGSNPTFAPPIIAFADAQGFSYMAWTWNDWGQSSNILIQDQSGTPTEGWGTYYKQHLICRTTSTSCK